MNQANADRLAKAVAAGLLLTLNKKEVVAFHDGTDAQLKASRTLLDTWDSTGDEEPTVSAAQALPHPSGLTVPLHWGYLAELLEAGITVTFTAQDLIFLYRTKDQHEKIKDFAQVMPLELTVEQDDWETHFTPTEGTGSRHALRRDAPPAPDPVRFVKVHTR